MSFLQLTGLLILRPLHMLVTKSGAFLLAKLAGKAPQSCETLQRPNEIAQKKGSITITRNEANQSKPEGKDPKP